MYFVFVFASSIFKIQLKWTIIFYGLDWPSILVGYKKTLDRFKMWYVILDYLRSFVFFVFVLDRFYCLSNNFALFGVFFCFVSVVLVGCIFVCLCVYVCLCVCVVVVVLVVFIKSIWPYWFWWVQRIHIYVFNTMHGVVVEWDQFNDSTFGKNLHRWEQILHHHPYQE